MYIKYACIYIDGVKVVLGTDGFCNISKVKVCYASASPAVRTWAIKVNGATYKLSRLMAHLFIDNSITINETRNIREKVVGFINNNPMDVRIDNLIVLNQTENINRHHSIEDDVYFIDLKGNIIECGQKAELCRKYKVNKGVLTDCLKGNNNHFSITIGENKVKCIAINGKDYSKDEVKTRLTKKRTSRVFKKDDKFLQVDVDGKYRILTKEDAKILLGDTAGLNMCLQGKRLTAGGYIWIPLDDYKKDNSLIEKKLSTVKSNMFYGSKIKLKKF